MDRSGGGEKVKEKGRDRDVGLNGRGDVRAGRLSKEDNIKQPRSIEADALWT